MISRVFSVFVTISFVFAAFCDKMPQLCSAIIDGASDAVSLTVSLVGMMCLWSGIIRVLDGAGVTKLISKLIRPLLKFAYPAAYYANCGLDEISANFAANLLGLGNAALPTGLAAMEKLSGKGISTVTLKASIFRSSVKPPFASGTLSAKAR